MEDRNNQKPYGVVTEQGDMGLGFSVLNESEKKTVQEHQEQNQRDRG